MIRLDFTSTPEGKFEFHQRVDGLAGRIVDVDETLVRTRAGTARVILVDKVERLTVKTRGVWAGV